MSSSNFLHALHLMRTYGQSGGEQQLSQLFGTNHSAKVSESFAFLYKDLDCERLFAARAPQLTQVVLSARPQRPGNAWYELLTLIPRLPLLQWRYFWHVRKTNPDACVVHGFQAALVAWPTACWKRTRHAYVHRITKSKSRAAWIFRILYGPFSVVAGNSRAVMESMIPYASSKRMMILNNGIDLERFDQNKVSAVLEAEAYPGGPAVVISLGRLLPYKGQNLVIDAFASLLPIHSNLRLWIVGEGVSRNELEKRVGSLGIESKVEFLGHRQDIPELLGRSRVFVNASSWEGMSNAVLEGMAASLPSVVVDAPGVSECHLNGVTGLVVCREARALARAVDELLIDRDRANRMGRAARRRVESNYSIAASRERYNDLYSFLAKGREKRSKRCVE